MRILPFGNYSFPRGLSQRKDVFPISRVIDRCGVSSSHFMRGVGISADMSSLQVSTGGAGENVNTSRFSNRDFETGNGTTIQMNGIAITRLIVVPFVVQIRSGLLALGGHKKSSALYFF